MAARPTASTTTARSSALVEGFSSQKLTVVARYPNADVVASGWLKGEDLMAGRAAVVSIDMNPGRIVLFGLRPQHRAQTHATFPMLFNALYLAADGRGRIVPALIPLRFALILIISVFDGVDDVRGPRCRNDRAARRAGRCAESRGPRAACTVKPAGATASLTASPSPPAA